MDKLATAITSLIDRLMFPLGLLVAYLLYRKFFVGDKHKEEAQKEAAASVHQDDLVPDYKDPNKAKTAAAKKKVIIENGKEATRYKRALYAEKIRGCTEFGFDITRVSKLNVIAADMKKHKVSLSGTAQQYKNMSGEDLYKDVRTVMGGDYTKWLSVAGSTK